ncbi:MAG: hypothetical protein AAF442_01920 [Pseudomonadota bacterium]
MSLYRLIQQRRDDVRKKIQALQEELDRCDAALAAVGSSDLVAGVATDDLGDAWGLAGLVGEDKKTIKDMIVDVLRDHPEGLKVADVASQIYVRYGQRHRQASLSSQLSRLKASGEAELVGRLWSVPSHLAGALSSGFVPASLEGGVPAEGELEGVSQAPFDPYQGLDDGLVEMPLDDQDAPITTRRPGT